MSISLKQWEEKVVELDLPNHFWINGKAVDAKNGSTFDSINPATGKVMTKTAAGSSSDIDAAVSAGRTAFNSGVWANASPSDRKVHC